MEIMKIVKYDFCSANHRSVVSAMTMVVMVILAVEVAVEGQIINPACTNSMINSLSPCLNYITQGSSNSTNGSSSSPTADCCSSLQSLTSASMDCACLIVNGNMPFRVPINRTLAISLPRACNMSKVNVQCKASVAPVPAPGPAVSFGPAPSPTTATRDLRPPTPSPEAGTTLGMTPTSPPVSSDGPTEVPGIRPVLTPPNSSSSKLTHKPLLLFILGVLLFKHLL